MTADYGHQKKQWIFVCLCIILLILFVISFGFGRYPISIKELFGILWSKIASLEPFWADRTETIFFQVRLPRILLSCMVGCCLSAAGASYQGIFQNPMASPDVLGASQGASFGAALAILLGFGKSGVTLSAFIFSLLTVLVVWLFSKKIKGKQIVGLVLSGIMISSLFSSGTSFIKLVADPMEQLPAITYWLMGSLTGAKLDEVFIALIPMAIGLIPLLMLRWRMNLLTLGEEEAKTLGVNTSLLRLIVVLCATLVTATSVAVSGTIGWVGLVIPHFSRKLVGNNYRYLLPVSMVFGAIFLLLVDNVSRNLLTTEIPIGILTSFIGAPFFLYLMLKGGDSV